MQKRTWLSFIAGIGMIQTAVIATEPLQREERVGESQRGEFAKILTEQIEAQEKYDCTLYKRGVYKDASQLNELSNACNDLGGYLYALGTYHFGKESPYATRWVCLKAKAYNTSMLQDSSEKDRKA